MKRSRFFSTISFTLVFVLLITAFPNLGPSPEAKPVSAIAPISLTDQPISTEEMEASPYTVSSNQDPLD